MHLIVALLLEKIPCRCLNQSSGRDYQQTDEKQPFRIDCTTFKSIGSFTKYLSHLKGVYYRTSVIPLFGSNIWFYVSYSLHGFRLRMTSQQNFTLSLSFEMFFISAFIAVPFTSILSLGKILGSHFYTFLLLEKYSCCKIKTIQDKTEHT